MPRVGNIIADKYRLLEPIGEGSMGAVWRAQHETLGCPFAIKFLKDFSADGFCLEERFFTEARISAAVRHPCVVDVFDYGVTDEGTPYIVMEFLEGECLAARLERDPPLGVRELLRIVIAACGGLQAVHEAGVIHRDLKPENLVLGRAPQPNPSTGVDDEGDHVAPPKLVDFGISRILDAHSPRRLTVPGTTVGTPWYMAPEQAQGLPDLDARVDVYAMGVVLYEALSGRLPFEHDNLQMLMLMVAAGHAPPLSRARDDLPRALSDVIARAMDVTPAARFASAAALAQALRALLPLVPATAICPRRGEPLPRNARGPAAAKSTRAWEKRPASRTPTLPVALARLGLARMPARPVLLGSGALAAAAAVAAFIGLHDGRSDAAVPARPTTSVARRAPDMSFTSVTSAQEPPEWTTETAVSEATTTAAPAPPAPRPRRARPTPPEMFRDPGF